MKKGMFFDYFDLTGGGRGDAWGRGPGSNLNFLPFGHDPILFFVKFGMPLGLEITFWEDVVMMLHGFEWGAKKLNNKMHNFCFNSRF